MWRWVMVFPIMVPIAFAIVAVGLTCLVLILADALTDWAAGR